MLEVHIVSSNRHFRGHVVPNEDIRQDYMENVMSAEWGWSRTFDEDGNPGPSIEVESFTYVNGGRAGMLAIKNDCIENPCGPIDWAAVYATWNGEVVFRKHDDFWDETGFAIRFGDYQWATRQKFVIMPPIPYDIGHANPALGSLEKGPLQKDTKRVPDSHTTGSPRNETTRYKAGQVYDPGNVKICNNLMDYVADQMNRPYHLTRLETGEVWNAFTDYAVDGENLQHAIHHDGQVRTDHHAQWNDKLGRSGFHKPPAKGRGITGFDWEHLSNEELAEAAVLLGSRIAAREVEHIHEKLFMRDDFEEHRLRKVRAEGHSDRAAGWSLMELYYAYQTFTHHGMEDKAERARGCAVSLMNKISTNELNRLVTGKIPEWNHPFLIGREVQGNAFKPDQAIASVWQIAPIGMGAAYWSTVLSNVVTKDLVNRCVAVAHLHWAPDQGFYENVLLSSPEDSPEFIGYWKNGKTVPDIMGTAFWITPVLAFAALKLRSEIAMNILNDLEPRLNFMRPDGQYDYLWHQGYHAVDTYFLQEG